MSTFYCLMAALEKARGIKKYNVGKSPIEIAGLGDMIAKRLGLDIRTKIMNKARGIGEGRGTYDTRCCISDTRLIKEELGFEAGVSLEQGLSDTAEWAKKNKEMLIR